MKKRLICMALTLLMLVSLIPTAAFAAENPFTDVPETISGSPNPFYDAILWAVGKAITTGYEDNTFRPNNTCTRGHVVTFLWRSAGSPEPESLENIFSDVAESSPFYKAILWAAEQGITTGYDDGTFRPNAACTRAHVVTFLWRYENKPAAAGEVDLIDLGGLNADFTAAIRWAATNGITTGYSDGTFRPHAVCTRAHVVTFIYRDTANGTHTHHYTDVVTAPTCTEPGYTTHICSCGDSYKDSYIPALNHKWDNGRITKEPTATAKGEKLFTCTVCGITRTEVMGFAGHVHSYTETVIPPGCTENGYTLHTCSCGDSYKDNVTVAAGHKLTLSGTVAATCTEKGYSGDYVCSVCGLVAAAGHDVAATGHIWGDAVIKRPTKDKAGSKIFTCSACGETRTEEIPPVGHVLCLVSEKTSDDGIETTWTYEHDEYGNIVSGVLKNFSGNKLGTMTAVYFDPALGNLKQTIRTTIFETETTVYDEVSGGIKTQMIVGSDGKVSSTLDNTYNAQGLITKSISENNSLGMKSTREYFYGADGSLVKDVLEIVYDGISTSELLTTEYTYTDGRLTGMSTSGHSADGTENTSSVKIGYDAAGREIQRTMTVTAPASYTVSTEYTYDSNGNLVKGIQRSGSQTLSNSVYKYKEYDGVFYMIEESSVSTDDGEDTILYTYAFK